MTTTITELLAASWAASKRHIETSRASRAARIAGAPDAELDRLRDERRAAMAAYRLAYAAVSAH